MNKQKGLSIQECMQQKRCSVALFKKYMTLRPKEFRSADSPLYLQEHTGPSDTLWYKKQAIGREKIGGFMKSVAQAARLQGKKTNHSGRKTMLTRLVQQDVPHVLVAQLSAHKSLKSIDSYASSSGKQQKEMSYIISGKSQPPLSDCTTFTVLLHLLPTVFFLDLLSVVTIQSTCTLDRYLSSTSTSSTEKKVR